METPLRRARRALQPPSGFEGYLSRRQAAAALGLASEFGIRQLEKEGRLRAVRGRMGSAWYPRDQVLALRAAPAPVLTPGRDGRCSDAALVSLLRQPLEGRPRTAADLVVETGISIARAERVYRFWLARDHHPTATHARAHPPAASAAPPVVPPPEAALPAAVATRPERRSAARLSRAALIRQLRDPDPRVRAAAFTQLRPR